MADYSHWRVDAWHAGHWAACHYAAVEPIPEEEAVLLTTYSHWHGRAWAANHWHARQWVVVVELEEEAPVILTISHWPLMHWSEEHWTEDHFVGRTVSEGLGWSAGPWDRSLRITGLPVDLVTRLVVRAVSADGTDDGGYAIVDVIPRNNPPSGVAAGCLAAEVAE